MKSTGIVRTIDDLGRIVIPREIRNALLIKAGDPLEIFVDDNKIIFQPYVEHDEPWRFLESAIYHIKENDVFSNDTCKDLEKVIATLKKEARNAK